jgi:UV DNA damage endonuclease
MNLGYCCINTALQKEGIFTSRGMRKATFESKGLSYVSELALLNLYDLKKVLQWNVNHNITNFRISSDLFPWGFTYNICNLPNSDVIIRELEEIGNYIKLHGIRATFHPSHFTVLGSDNPVTVDKSIKELNHHSQIFDLMRLPATPYHCINIHLANTKPTKALAAQRFCENFPKLDENTQKRLTVENDDYTNQYSVKDLFELIYVNTGVPIVFDQFHFLLGPQDQTMSEAMFMAASTWPCKQLIHFSSARKHEDTFARITAHSDYLYERPQDFGLDVDVDVECKAKEQGVLRLLNEFNSLTPIDDMSVAKRLLEMNKYSSERQNLGEALGFFAPKSKILNVRKGDTVTLLEGQQGIVIKYPNNKEISIKTETDVLIVSKEEILSVI